jgi:hypothetical protein
MEFYSVQLKEKVTVEDSTVTVTTMKNGRKAAIAELDRAGQKIKLFKILGKADAEKLAKK